MYEKDCSIEHPRNLGKIPELFKLTKEDMPKTEINGEQYTDVTALLYRDSMYKKVYPGKAREKNSAETKSEKQRRNKLAKRRIDYERIKKRGLSEEDLIEAMLESGFSGRAIHEEVGIGDHYFRKCVESLKKQGRISWYGMARYTKEQEDEMLAMDMAGYTPEEIGAKQGRNKRAAERKLERLKRERGLV